MRITKLLTLTLLVVGVGLFFGCEGPEGPAGPAGPAGADGMDGADANVTCLGCHAEDVWTGIEAHYALSGHANPGFGLSYAGSRASCSRCHSSEGFANFVLGYPGEDITHPTKLSCQSCHGNHGVLEGEISAPMATTDVITLIVDETMTVDLEGPSNLCGQCHNSRRNGSYYEALDSISIDGVLTEVGAGNVGISSTHAGPHYSAQVNTMKGMGGYGTSSVGTHATLGCVGCHMGATTETSGGHSFVPNLNNCTESCHSSVSDIAAFTTEKQDAVHDRMDAIGEALVAVGAMTTDGAGHYSPAVSIVTQAEFEAFWNYRVMYQDHSYGIHNPGYYNTMLTTAETNLGL